MRLQGLFEDIPDTGNVALLQIGFPSVGSPVVGGGCQHKEDMRRAVKRARLAQPRSSSLTPAHDTSGVG